MDELSSESRLVYQHPGYPTAEGITFHVVDDVLDVDTFPDVIWEIIKLADGTATKNEILEQLSETNMDATVASDIIDDLLSLEVLGSVKEQYKRFHSYSNNPTRYLGELSTAQVAKLEESSHTVEKQGQRKKLQPKDTKIGKITRQRESVRSFTRESINSVELASILNSMYSLESKPIPSAGGLNALKIYVIVRRGEELPTGYYQYDPDDSTLILFNQFVDERSIEHSFNMEPPIYDAPVSVVIAVDLDKLTEKYSNRGYRYALLEAGHAAQNAHLTVTELGLASLEYGGFNDNILAEELELDEGILPIISIGLGHKNQEQRITNAESLNVLEKHYVGKDKPVEFVSINLFTEPRPRSSFFQAYARFSTPNNSYHTDKERATFGTSASMEMAKIKAIAEAYERFASGRYRIDAICTADELDGEWVDPRQVRPLTDTQLERIGRLQRFKVSEPMHWVIGFREGSNTPIHVPIDIVYYPLQHEDLGRRLIFESDSSGVAAHTNERQAKRRAVYELIERDAIMRHWFSKEPLPAFDNSTLNFHHQKRIRSIEEAGFDTRLIDMGEIAGVPTVNVMIKNIDNRFPYFTSGCSSAFTYGEAVEKAIDEAELGLRYALMDQNRYHNLTPDNVKSPSEHGNYYLEPKNKHAIAWMWNGVVKPYDEHLLKNIDIISQYNPIHVQLSLEGDPLYVTRAIIPELVPISFGVDWEHFSHANSGAPYGYKPVEPHFFA